MGVLVFPSQALSGADLDSVGPECCSSSPVHREVCSARNHSNFYVPGCVLIQCQATASAWNPGIQLLDWGILLSVALTIGPLPSDTRQRHELKIHSSPDQWGSTWARQEPQTLSGKCPGEVPCAHARAGSHRFEVRTWTRLYATHPIAVPLHGRPARLPFFLPFQVFIFIHFFCIKKKSIITTNYKRLKQD